MPNGIVIIVGKILMNGIWQWLTTALSHNMIAKLVKKHTKKCNVNWDLNIHVKNASTFVYVKVIVFNQIHILFILHQKKILTINIGHGSWNVNNKEIKIKIKILK